MTETSASADADRRVAVLESALLTFARFGYRRTSMEQVANDAAISRPGLYYLFASKQTLFREAVEHSIHHDLAAAEQSLSAPGASLRERLLRAFDHWAGRYIGPLTRDVAAVVEDNPGVLGPIVQLAPQRFADLIVVAISANVSTRASKIANTLISTSIGIKHQVNDRQDYLDRLGVAIELLVPVPMAESTLVR